MLRKNRGITLIALIITINKSCVGADLSARPAPEAF